VVGVQTITLAPAQAVSGSDWRAGHIIDDSVFYNKGSMSVDQIQQFLNSKVPTCDEQGTQPYAGTTRRAYAEARGVKFPLTCLKSYQENTSTHDNNLEGRSVPAGSKGSAQIIWEAAQQYSISPQVLLVLLQKEQGLVLDDWPWPIEYRSAAGYGCPDTAVCDSQYYGFFNQVNNAARQFRLYANNPNSYNYVPGAGNNIQYNPNASCGSSGVTIDNQATASLYNYTPYQPNQAALANLYTTGDGCSAYGNRNFWRTFNDWFGASSGIDPLLVSANNGNPTQYVLYGNALYPIPSAEIKLAWGLDKLVLTQISADYVASLPTKSSLTRVLKPDNSGTVFLADNGLKYGFTSQQVMSAWGYSSSDISSVPARLSDMLATSNPLARVIHSPPSGASGMYLVDGNTVHLIDSPDTFVAWQGDSSTAIIPSDALFSHYVVGTPITTFKIQSSSGQGYIVNAGLKLPADSATFSAFPGAPAIVGDPLLNALVNGPNATPVVRAAIASTIFLMDGGQKHGFMTPAHLLAYSNNGQLATTVLTQGHLNKIAQGFDISSFLANNSSGTATYLMNGSKRQIPSAQLQSFLGGGQTPIVISDAVLSQLNSGPPVTKFIQAAGQPAVNVMDNGTFKIFPTYQDFILWGGDVSQITYVSQEALTQFPNSGVVTAYVNNGTTTYLLGQPGVLYTIDSGTANNWRIGGSPVQVNPNTLSGFSNGGLLPSAFSAGSKTYFMRKGTGYSSSDANMLTIWGLSSGMPGLNGAVGKFFTEKPLTKYVASSDAGDGKIYLVSEGTFLYISTPTMMQNQGYVGEGVVDANANDLTARGTTNWSNTLVKDSGNNYYTFDMGTKRPIDPIATSQWTNNQSTPAQPVSQAFLNLFNTGASVGKSIHSTDGDTRIYAVINNQKQWVTSYANYVQQYAPESRISPQLRDSLATGPQL
jgi:hypothetical protein